jgi:lysophospholipase L1-like esterase
MRRAAIVVAALLLGAGRLPPAATPISRDTLPWWHARHLAKLDELRRRPVDLVLLGDSITQNYERAGPPPSLDFRPVWQRFYADRHAVNLGFKGDATAHLLWRMMHGELDGIAPKAAIILIGANNLGRLHWSADDTVLGIEAVVAEARRRLPHAKILLLGILPSIRSPWATQTTQQVNAALSAQFGRGGAAGVTYLDVTSVFLTHGAVDPSLFYDPKLTPPESPLHPTPDAQARMAEAIEPALSAMLGDRPH